MHPRTIEIKAIGSLAGRAARARPIAGELAALPARQAAQGGTCSPRSGRAREWRQGVGRRRGSATAGGGGRGGSVKDGGKGQCGATSERWSFSRT
jgi:hypothetical protein